VAQVNTLLSGLRECEKNIKTINLRLDGQVGFQQTQN
jgi:hypothetical protein